MISASLRSNSFMMESRREVPLGERTDDKRSNLGLMNEVTKGRRDITMLGGDVKATQVLHCSAIKRPVNATARILFMVDRRGLGRSAIASERQGVQGVPMQQQQQRLGADAEWYLVFVSVDTQRRQNASKLFSEAKKGGNSGGEIRNSKKAFLFLSQVTLRDPFHSLPRKSCVVHE